MAEYPYVEGPGLAKFLQDMIKWGIPKKLTVKDVKGLGFKSSNHTRIPAVLKFIGLLDSSARPTALYKEFRDASQRSSTMARAIKQAYADLFRMYPDAHRKDQESLSNFFTAESKLEQSKIQAMVGTFGVLCSFADFDAIADEVPRSTEEVGQAPSPQIAVAGTQALQGLNINIQLELPITSQPEVYEALFRAMRKYILEASEDQ